MYTPSSSAVAAWADACVSRKSWPSFWKSILSRRDRKFSLASQWYVFQTEYNHILFNCFLKSFRPTFSTNKTCLAWIYWKDVLQLFLIWLWYESLIIFYPKTGCFIYLILIEHEYSSQFLNREGNSQALKGTTHRWSTTLNWSELFSRRNPNWKCGFIAAKRRQISKVFFNNWLFI